MITIQIYQVAIRYVEHITNQETSASDTSFCHHATCFVFQASEAMIARQSSIHLISAKALKSIAGEMALYSAGSLVTRSGTELLRNEMYPAPSCIYLAYK